MRGPGGCRFLLPLALFALPAAARTQPVEQTVESHRNDIGEIDRRGDQFVHRASGYVFPASLGEMPARKTYSYGPGDASVYYTMYGGGNGDPWLSLYVYPVTRPFEAEVRDVEAALEQRMPGSPTAPPGLPSLPAGVSEKWFEATVDGTWVITGYRLGQIGDWYVKVRLTIPRRGGQAGLGRAWNALAAVPWTMEQPTVPTASVLPARSAR